MCGGHAEFGMTATMPNPGLRRIGFCRNLDQDLNRG